MSFWAPSKAVSINKGETQMAIRPIRKALRMIGVAVVLALALGVAGCSATTESSTSEPGKNATEGNTPRVGPHGSVEVDTLRWRLRGARTAKTIGEQQYGLGAKANGIFVIADLSAKNNKSESVTLSSEAVSLVTGGKTYSSDSNAEIALTGSGANTFLLEDLGPGVTLKGSTAFDVAPSVLHQHPQLRFNELGFGETHGYIALPRLSG